MQAKPMQLHGLSYPIQKGKYTHQVHYGPISPGPHNYMIHMHDLSAQFGVATQFPEAQLYPNPIIICRK